MLRTATVGALVIGGAVALPGFALAGECCPDGLLDVTAPVTAPVTVGDVLDVNDALDTAAVVSDVL